MSTISIFNRPLDLTYFIFFAIHLSCSLTVDTLALWPEKTQTLPVIGLVYGVLRQTIDAYIAKTNDPLMLVNWGIVQRPWEFAHFKLFVWTEVFFKIPSFILGMIGLYKNSAAIYPLLLSYSAIGVITIATYMHGAYVAPSIKDPTLDPLSKFYAMSDEGRWTILAAATPILIVPLIMWVDMMIRLGRLVAKGERVGAQQKKVTIKKTKKEL